MNSISSVVNALLLYLVGSSWMEANVSCVPGIGAKGTWGLDNKGGDAANDAAALRCGKVAAIIFSASSAAHVEINMV